MSSNHFLKFEPIFFTPPSGKLSAPRKLYKGGSGGDGGAAERQKKEDNRVAAATQKINEIFGVANATPNAIDKKKYTKNIVTKAPTQNYGMGFNQQEPMGMGMGNLSIPKTNTKKVFDEAGYNAAVAEEQARIDKLKGAASSRENLYSKISTDANNNALVDLNKDRGITERELGFSLARNGLSGGSRDIDANKDVLDTYQQGVLKASNLGLEKANNARSMDDKTRVNLVNSVRSGLDEGSALQQSYEGMQNNARSAQDEANTVNLAGFFDSLRNLQSQQQYQAGLNQAVQSASSPKVAANRSYGGTTRSLA